MIAPLLLSLLSETTAPRGRAQELAGRLGLAGRPAAAPGTLARLLGIEARYGLAVRQAVEMFLLQARIATQEVAARNPPFSSRYLYRDGWYRISADGPSGVDWTPSKSMFHMQIGGFADEGFGRPERWFARPDPGIRTEADPLLSWVALQVSRARAARDVSELVASLGLEDFERDAPDTNNPGVSYMVPLRRAPRPGQMRDPDERAWLTGYLLGEDYARSPVRDYLEQEPPADLMSLSWRQLEERSRRWHARFVDAEGRGQPARPGIAVVVWPDGGRVERLVTARQLEQEGRSMGHCVGGYWPAVRDGRSVILSYRDARGVPAATAEVGIDRSSNGPGGPRVSLVQLQGPGNGLVEVQFAEQRLCDVLARLCDDLALPAAAVVPEVVARAAEEGPAAVDWGDYGSQAPPGSRPGDYDQVRKVLLALEELWAQRDLVGEERALYYRLVGEEVGAEEWRAMARERGLDRRSWRSGKAYAPTVMADWVDADQQYWATIPPLMRAIDDCGYYAARGGPRWRVKKLSSQERSDLGSHLRDCDVFDVEIRDHYVVLGSVVVRSDQAGDPDIWAYKDDDLRAAGMGSRAGESDYCPVQALCRAGVLVTPDEYARQRAAARDRTASLVLLDPPEVVLGDVAAHARAAAARGVDPDPDMRRLLRGTP